MGDRVIVGGGDGSVSVFEVGGRPYATRTPHARHTRPHALCCLLDTQIMQRQPPTHSLLSVHAGHARRRQQLPRLQPWPGGELHDLYRGQRDSAAAADGGAAPPARGALAVRHSPWLHLSRLSLR
eukprot:2283034-Prymnesium_polylepis.1